MKEVKKAKKGMRVHVFDDSGEISLGFGTIEEIGTLFLEKISKPIIDDYPIVIKLDSGEAVEGLDCWWYPCDTN